MKKIDFEAHFATQEWVDALYKNEGYPRLVEDKKEKTRRMYFTAEASEPFSDVLLGKLLDVGEKRLAFMDEAGIDMQVLTLTAPGVDHLDPDKGEALAKNANDATAEIMGKYPERFSGYATVSPKRPEAAARELERAVKELGLKGWKTHSNFGDSYIDEKTYWPILAKAEELDVPIYLHPTVPMIPQLRTYGIALAGAPFGFGMETAMTMMRLIFSGALDAFPNLKFILGHLGEGLPFILQRIDFAFVRPHFRSDPAVCPALERKPSEYLKENMFVSTSGNYLEPAFICTKDALGIDRIVLGTDYPYEDSSECMQFLEGLPLSGEEKERVYGLNAKQVGYPAS
ncbi:MAG: amidohydrolase [Deltaproteobacteria bacterium]|nr:amidohydrolase [Deltaproteobacteria bacterium]